MLVRTGLIPGESRPADERLGLDHRKHGGPPRLKPTKGDPRQAIKVIETGQRLFALEHRDLSAQRQDFETKLVACTNEPLLVVEQVEHGTSGIVDDFVAAQRLQGQ